MAGSNPFLIDKSAEFFGKSFRKLIKSTGQGLQKTLIDETGRLIEGLANDPRPTSSRQETKPKQIPLPPLCEFRKLSFTISKGAAGQIRLMYLADFDRQVIKPLWIYSHEQFAKRPPDRDIATAIADLLEG